MKVVDVMTSGMENTDTAAGDGHDPDLGSQSVAMLAGELGSLAAGIAARTGRFLVVLGEFDAREAWGEYAGILSTSHWLSWQCGMAGVTAREQVRVARALRHLAATTAELTAGRLSYSKVRAISRVATADTEPELIDIARAGTAEQVDRFCAGVRAATGNLAEVNARHQRRSLSYRTLEDGSVSISVRCGPEEGAEVIEALRRAQDYLETTASDQDDSTQNGSVQDPGAHALLDALLLVCSQSEVGPGDADECGVSAGADVESGAGGDESGVDDTGRAKPTTIGSLQQHLKVSGPPRLRASRRSETVLHATLEELAATTVINKTESLLGPRLEFGPALHAETARRLACDTGLVLQLYEAPAAAEHDPSVVTDAPEQTQPAPWRAAWARPSGRRGRIIDVGRRSRRPNASLLRALWNRDGGCVFPGCARRRYLHGHHIVHWADGGATTLENMVLLCGQHHRCLHEGGFSLTRVRDGSLRFTDGNGMALSATRCEASGPEPTDEIGPDGSGPLAATDAHLLDLKHAVSTVIGLWEWRRKDHQQHQWAETPYSADSISHPSETARETGGKTDRDIA